MLLANKKFFYKSATTIRAWLRPLRGAFLIPPVLLVVADFSALNYAIFRILNGTLINEADCLIEHAAEKLVYAAHRFFNFHVQILLCFGD